jgi:hypothetical protein
MTATGLYDNSRTGRREEWSDGKLVGVAGVSTFAMRAFGFYPDHPANLKDKRCISCGATPADSGTLPCDH